MTGLRLLADDLTGALDAAAPFAAARAPIEVTWLDEDMSASPDHAWSGVDAAISSTSRELPAGAAAQRVRNLATGLAFGKPAFKKIDSLLRGNTAIEIVTAHRAGGFARTFVSPAFPAQGRIMRGGKLTVRGATGEEAEGPDLAAMLGATGAECAITVCHVECDADHAALVEAHRGDRSVLWAGSSGLARALSGPSDALSMPKASQMLIVTASRHPATRMQLSAFAKAWPQALLYDAGTLDAATLGREAARRLGQGESLVLDASPSSMPALHAPERMAQCFASLAGARRPALLVAIGGDTLTRLLAAVGCRRLVVRGEVAPGLPLAELGDGAWAGVSLISRSGAFNDGGTIACALAAAASGT